MSDPTLDPKADLMFDPTSGLTTSEILGELDSATTSPVILESWTGAQVSSSDKESS
jgi:hypothetical protein